MIEAQVEAGRLFSGCGFSLLLSTACNLPGLFNRRLYVLCCTWTVCIQEPVLHLCESLSTCAFVLYLDVSV